ncbi:hypothetical protein GCM10027594_23120 [Hymenobacter agri]
MPFLPHGFSLPRPASLLALCLLSTAGIAQPVVTTLTPARNTQVARTGFVRAEFSQALEARASRALRVFSSQAGGRKVGTGTVSGNALTFSPTAPFKAGETVWATLDTAARGLNHQSIARPQVWQFTAAATASSGVFSGGSTIGVPNSTSTLTVGDVDNDGDLDLLTNHSQLLAVRLNDGTGDYGSGADIQSAHAVQNAQLGDIDGDGDLDLVTIENPDFASSVGYYSVRRNNGGGFASPVTVPVSNDGYTGLALHDMDGDGDLDMVAIAATSLVILLNDGTGTFAVRGSIAQPYVKSFTVGDVDNDGDLDVLFFNSANSTVGVRLNSGSGTSFTTGTSVPSALNTFIEVLRLNDVDNDGDLDLLLLSSDPNSPAYSVVVRLNNGAGVLSGGNTLPITTQPQNMTTGDIDGDGDLDLLAIHHTGGNTNTVSTWLNNGAGTFAAGTSVSVGSYATQLALADIDDDGDVDLVSIGQGQQQGEVVVRRNGGNAVAAYAVASVAPQPNAVVPRSAGISATFPLAMGTDAGTVAALRAFSSRTGGRVAGTGTVAGATLSFAPSQPFLPGETVQATVPKAARSSTGVALARPYVWQFTAAVSGGTGQFTTGTVVAPPFSGYPLTMRLADIDGDRDLDIITAFSSGSPAPAEQLSVLRNNGRGGFAAPVPLLGATIHASFFVLGDVDNDGDLDFVGATYDTADPLARNTVYFNNGQGTFAPGGGVASIVEGDLALGDVDGDGDLDVVNGMVRLNDGHGNFYGSAIFNLAVISNPSAMRGAALADLDGDGDLDFVGSIGSELIEGLNDGAGNFQSAPNFGRLTNIYDIMVRDFDGDNDADVAVGDQLWLNDGTGKFTSRALPIYGSFVIAAGDVDADGDADLLTSRGTSYSNYLLLNDGRGVFTNPNNAVTSAAYVGALGDLDGDGDLDAVGALDYTGGWRIRYNGTTTATTAAQPTAQQMQVWPNPVSAGSALQLTLTQPAVAASATLTTLTGQVVRTQQFAGAGTRFLLGAVPSGCYLLTVQAANQMPSTQRLIVE